ncbi:unnamed protein product [Rotaria sordida]|uniref:Uncharacterized protein n=1 Tax=Rotaria sordida TaxID=392033 RepID=A0A819TZC2_9BILA|nr:unnamed protein product [Rotaria sordida]
MPREYLVTMLSPAIGHFLNDTIIGYPSVNKSSATEAILNACLAIEKHIGIKPEESRVNCSATVESLLTELKNTSPRLIQIWDEAVTLLQSFGLYKQGGAAYDRSIMCTLYNSSAFVRRQTKSGNIAVGNPVLNIAAAARPADIFSSVSSPVHETLDEMRQRLEQKRNEQEQIEKNQEIVAESRRSKVAKVPLRSDDAGAQRYPEKHGSAPSREDIVISPPQPTILPRIGIQTIASQSTNHGLLTPPLPPSPTKKNRVEPIELPTSLFASPRRDIPPPSQEYPYQNI